MPACLTISVEKEGIGEEHRMGVHEMRLRLRLTLAVHDLGTALPIEGTNQVSFGTSVSVVASALVVIITTVELQKVSISSSVQD